MSTGKDVRNSKMLKNGAGYPMKEPFYFYNIYHCTRSQLYKIICIVLLCITAQSVALENIANESRTWAQAGDKIGRAESKLYDEDQEEIPPPEFSQKRGFYRDAFQLELTTDVPGAKIRYTTDHTKPSEVDGELYVAPIQISKMTTVRAVAYIENSECSRVRTHSFVFPADVLKQDDSDLPTEQHSKDHVFWTEEFDMSDVSQTEEEMVEALLDIPTIFVSAPYDSIFGVAGIHRGQNLEENGGDPPDPNWHEIVECSVEMIYPETNRNGRFKNWQENCGIKIQGGAGRWKNGYFDHKQSFTLEFKSKYGAGMLKHDFLESAPFNSESSPKKFDKIIIRTGFNRDWGSDWDRANCAYTRDQFGRDLQILMSGWGCHGTYAHLYINGKYWGQYNPCERMDNDALATYFGGESEDYFYGKGKGGIRYGDPERYNYLNKTNWTNRQLSELEEYLAVDEYIDVALVYTYANAGDGPQYYFGCRTNPPGPLYYTAWDLEDSFDGGARRSGPPVSMENYNMPYSGDKFLAYFKVKNNIDFKMRFADRVYKHCFNDGVLADDQVVAIWDSSCRVIEKSILCEIARWGDERGEVYDYDHWKKECNDVREDLIGRAARFVRELKKSGMYPDIEVPLFRAGNEFITSDVYNCHENFELIIAPSDHGNGKIYYTTDNSDPRAWDLTGNVSASAIEAAGKVVKIPIDRIMAVKARIKDSTTWSPLAELKLIPRQSSQIVINEINYNSSPEFDTEDWVEIYNDSDVDISLAGWTLKDSQDDNIFHFDDQTVLTKNAFLVICRDTLAFKQFNKDVINVIGNFDFKLSREGDAIRILDHNNTLVDSVTYEPKKPWPVYANGRGATLELLNPKYDNSQPENWQATKEYGTPGRSNSKLLTTKVKDNKKQTHQPKECSLLQNYPNPFNPVTTIQYKTAKPGHVHLAIFNLNGQLVETLVNEKQNAGWHAVSWNARNIASGVYIYRLQSNEFSKARKLVVIK